MAPWPAWIRAGSRRVPVVVSRGAGRFRNVLDRWRRTWTPPPLALLELGTGAWPAQALYVVARLGVADALKDGPKSTEELARVTDAHEPSLFRVLRVLASLGVFEERQDGTFGLTRMGHYLRRDVAGSMRDGILYYNDPYHWSAWNGFYQGVKTGQGAFVEVHGTGHYDFLAHHPEEQRVFDTAMRSLSSSASVAVARSYDFSGVRTGIDIGGGIGTLIATILRENPEMRGVVFDQPAVEALAREHLRDVGVADRCEVATGSFFESIPGGMDVYLLKNVLHGWDDEHALTILRNCRAGMGPGARLLVIDMIMPEGPEPFFGKQLDLLMMMLYAVGRDRSVPEYAKLLEQAGLKMSRVVHTYTPVSILEAVPV